MPVSPEKNKQYPGGSIRSQAWQDVRAWVALRSGNKCEGSPAFPDCRAANGKPHPVTKSKVILTVAHPNHCPKKNGPDDLRHWCQRCHNVHDQPFRAKNARIKKSRAKRLMNLRLEKNA